MKKLNCYVEVPNWGNIVGAILFLLTMGGLVFGNFLIGATFVGNNMGASMVSVFTVITIMMLTLLLLLISNEEGAFKRKVPVKIRKGKACV